MNIDSIEKGIVLDHITAGKGMEIYRLLNLDQLGCSVALIRNIRSKKLGKKDMIKIGDTISLNFDALGYVDPGITVNLIENGKVLEKKRLSLPCRLVNIKTCKNPRCITTVEPGLDQIFVLADRTGAKYKCFYCEAE